MAIDMLTPQDVCTLLKISRRTLQAWVSAGRFPAPIRLSHTLVRFKREEIERFLSPKTR
jgi:excisionase family DNA binding protein